MSGGGAGKSILRQQYETLEYQLQHLKDSRVYCIFGAAAPTVIWSLYGALGAFAVGNPTGAVLVLIVAGLIVAGLFTKGKITSGLAQVGAFMFALAGAAVPMAVGGWIIMGRAVVVFAAIGLGACWTLMKNEIDTSRTIERMEELAPKVGIRKKAA